MEIIELLERMDHLYKKIINMRTRFNKLIAEGFFEGDEIEDLDKKITDIENILEFEFKKWTDN